MKTKHLFGLVLLGIIAFSLGTVAGAEAQKRTDSLELPQQYEMDERGSLTEMRDYVVAYQHLNITTTNEELKQTMVITPHGNMIVDGYWYFDTDIQQSFNKVDGKWHVSLIP